MISHALCHYSRRLYFQKGCINKFFRATRSCYAADGATEHRYLSLRCCITSKNLNEDYKLKHAVPGQLF